MTNPRVITRSGKLEGYQSGGLSIFKGIAYAAAPVRERRWLPPAPHPGWEGVRSATTFGAIAPQNSSALDGMLGQVAQAPEQSEDCLFLNVWTPGLDDARRAVMVWIHGGGFTIGSGSSLIYDGASLASRGDVVVVTLNYRMGALGFMNLAELTNGAIPATGNEGLLDQASALAWVNENIAAFGGDPENVTVFGESAGGMSVGALMAMPLAQGRFHKAIPQSGACHTAITREQARAVSAAFVDAVKVDATDTQALRALTIEQLLAGQAKVALKAASLGLPGMSFQPVIDGSVLPSLPIEQISAGAAKGIAVMAGSTLEEWKLFSALNPATREMTEENLQTQVSRRVSAGAKELIAVYRRFLECQDKAATPGAIATAITTDHAFRIPAIKLLEAQAAHDARVYNYIFDWNSPAAGGILGACHAVELGYVFGTYNLNGSSRFFGEGAQADALAAVTMDAWLQFAKTGNPGGGAVGDWPGYDTATRATMILSARHRIENAPYDEARSVWESVETDIGRL